MATLEQRVSELENQIKQLLLQQADAAGIEGEPWWKQHSGAFKDDPLYDEAMRLGAEYRRAQPNAADSPDAFTY